MKVMGWNDMIDCRLVQHDRKGRGVANPVPFNLSKCTFPKEWTILDRPLILKSSRTAPIVDPLDGTSFSCVHVIFPEIQKLIKELNISIVFLILLRLYLMSKSWQKQLIFYKKLQDFRIFGNSAKTLYYMAEVSTIKLNAWEIPI